MKTKYLVAILLCVFLSVQATTTQTSNKKTTATAPKHYPNPYDTPDPNRPVKQDPFTWKDFPANISSSKEMQAAYAEALKNKDGYRLLQLAKIEYDHTYTYGSLNPNKLIQDAFQIADNNNDPYLSFYLMRFNSEENFSATLSETRAMAKTAYLQAMARKDTSVLFRLCDLEDARDVVILENMSTKEIRKQALFINNKNYVPYPNPYDNPIPDKPLNRSPFVWKDFPTDITTETQLKTAYNEALKTNDGYKLLQLAKVASDKSLSKTVTAEMLLTKAYAIAQYNKDPYLMIDITLLEKEKNLLKNAEPADIFRKAYNTAIERRDSKPLYLMYSYETKNNFLPDLNPGNIMEKAEEIKKIYKEPLI